MVRVLTVVVENPVQFPRGGSEPPETPAPGHRAHTWLTDIHASQSNTYNKINKI